MTEQPRPRHHAARPTRAGRHRVPAAVALALAAALLGACGGKTPASTDSAAGSESPSTVAQAGSSGVQLEAEETPVDGGHLVVGVPAETNGWNPVFSQWADAGSLVGSSVLEPLVVMDETGVPVPWLAEKVEPSRAGSFDAWRITIRPDITFHNGERLTADVVKQNIDLRVSDGALSALVLKPMLEGVEVIDDRTVEVELTQPWAAYPSSMVNYYMMAPEQIGAANNGRDRPIGTGPYVFESWVPDNSFKVKRNDAYWRKASTGSGSHVADIEFRPIPDEAARVQSLKAGDLDLILGTRASTVDEAEEDFTVVADYRSEKAYVLLNTAEDPAKGPNPFANVHARRAISYATDRAAVQDAVAGDQKLESSTSMQIAGTRWEMDQATTGALEHDLAKAREEVALYLAETNRTSFECVLAGVSTTEDQRTMQLLQAQWAEAGITCSVDTREQASYITQIVVGGYQAALFRGYGYPDPDANWSFLHSSQAKGLGVLSINFSQYKSGAIDKAMDDARQTDDENRRKADYEAATRALNEAAVNVWLYNTPYSMISHDRVRGLNSLRRQGFGNLLPKTALWADIWVKAA